MKYSNCSGNTEIYALGYVRHEWIWHFPPTLSSPHCSRYHFSCKQRLKSSHFTASSINNAWEWERVCCPLLPVVFVCPCAPLSVSCFLVLSNKISKYPAAQKCSVRVQHCVCASRKFQRPFRCPPRKRINPHTDYHHCRHPADSLLLFFDCSAYYRIHFVIVFVFAHVCDLCLAFRSSAICQLGGRDTPTKEFRKVQKNGYRILALHT